MLLSRTYNNEEPKLIQFFNSMSFTLLESKCIDEMIKLNLKRKSQIRYTGNVNIVALHFKSQVVLTVTGISVSLSFTNNVVSF